MRRKPVLVGLAIALIAIVVILARSCGGRTASSSHSAGSAATAAGSASTRVKDRHVDPRTLQRASVAGTITDEAHAPVASARVCGQASSPALSAETTREPLCTISDPQGHYVLKDLVAANYTVVASARTFRPTAYHPDGDHRRTTFVLAAGEAKTGIDIALRAGGVEVTGTVFDVTGGPIEKALVRVIADWDEPASPPVETDAQGTFSLWSAPGQVAVRAMAEGYAASIEMGRAPGTFELLLTPESSLAGTVVDAITNEPVPGVTVTLRGSDTGGWDGTSGPSDVTDDKGAFHITRLSPGRFSATATSPHGHGRANGSTLVGLGQHVDGVVVKLHAGFRISGRVTRPDKSVCLGAELGLVDKERDGWIDPTTEPSGDIHADGLLPGTYQVTIQCPGFVPHERYDAITIVDKDVDNVEWSVDAGATIKGRLVTKRGEPVPDAAVFARITGKGPRGQNGAADTTLADGSFTLGGLTPGSYKLDASTEKGVAPLGGWSVEVPAGAVLDKELVLDDAGRVTGTVVDAEGKPVGNVLVRAQPVAARIGEEAERTRSDGTFVIEGLVPGEYRISAQRDWANAMRRPSSRDDDKQGERVSLAPGKTVTVKLVVESQSGTIKGTVVGSDGAPVTDAYVSAAREQEGGAPGGAVVQTRWTWGNKPVITGIDGSFTLTKLSPGTYTVRAAIRGGGEAVAEHVPAGATTKLELRPTGSITGHVTATVGEVDDYSAELRNAKTGFSRRERYFRNGGTFTLDALPAGHYVLTISSGRGKKQVETDLAEGENATVTVALEPLVTLTGRVIDQVTKQPVAGMRMMVQLRNGGGGFSMRTAMDPNEPNVSGDDGRFTINDAPSGPVVLRGFPRDFRDSDYVGIQTPRDVSGTGTVDIGDVVALKRRVKQGEPVGELGLVFADDPPGTPLEARIFKVRSIDPQGPAAKSGINVGDVVTSIDGIDITGANAGNAWTLLTAPPGTRLALGLQRGATISITLAPP